MRRICLFTFISFISFYSFSQDLDQVLKELDEIKKKIDSLKTEDSNELRFSVGGNVNFLEEVRLNGLYYDISAFIPKPFKKTTWLKRWGVDTRLSQGRLDISDDTLNTTFSRNVFINDSIGLTQRYRISEKEQANYLNLSISPTFNIGKDDNLYLVGYFEYFRRRNNTELNTFIVSVDSIQIVDPADFTSVAVEDNTIELDRSFDLFNYGLGVKFYTPIGKNVILNIRPVIGVGFIQQQCALFYHTQFEAIEQKHGFKFGGEIRGYLGDNNNRNLEQFYAPFVNVFIAKTFTFNTLGKFLLGE